MFTAGKAEVPLILQISILTCKDKKDIKTLNSRSNCETPMYLATVAILCELHLKKMSECQTKAGKQEYF